METTKKSDFIELKYTGYANGEIFDSNIEEDLKKLNPEAKPEKTTIVIGQGMVVRGFDKALEDKEIGKEYEVNIPSKEAFGARKRELIRTISLASFTEKKVQPQPGMILALDNTIVKIIAVSGARVTADFNNLLAGKDLKYKFTITRKIEDEKEKSETLFQFFFKSTPELEIKESSITVKLPKQMEPLVALYKDKFKEIIGKELVFEEEKDEPKEPTPSTESPSSPTTETPKE